MAKKRYEGAFDMDSASPDPERLPAKLIVRYTDDTYNVEFFEGAPHDYAEHLTLVNTVDSARIEVVGSHPSEWYEYRDGVRVGQAVLTAQEGARPERGGENT
ncbi:hypothetical protein [Streptomyces shenzhenensis]|uniref:hypothetical protein n=1 Tax=Streptomyces shenzhenensis TaxID=943815 RepID=UPI001F43E059|nr:hypothetical protein [Streptomyces shenzhenensis]